MFRPTMMLRASHGRPGNVTGFDINRLKEAAEKPVYDPWERNERWRYTGLFSRWNRFRGAFPGLGIATVAFAAYCGYEYMFLKNEHHGEGHGEGHSQGHH